MHWLYLKDSVFSKRPRKGLTVIRGVCAPRRSASFRILCEHWGAEETERVSGILGTAMLNCSLKMHLGGRAQSMTDSVWYL
jgi:hypothetical protein